MRQTTIPTPRALLLLLTAAPFLAAAAFLPWLGLLCPLLWLGTAVLIWLDVRRSPQPADFTVERIHLRKLSVRAHNPIDVIVHNNSGQDVTIWVRDTIPTDFRVEHGRTVLMSALPQHSTVTLGYRVWPARRGEYRFGDINLRWSSAWGLVLRQGVMAGETAVKVYPNLLNIREYENLARRGRVGQIGVRRSQTLGRGSEFEQLRDYMPDDDYRRICWTATARRGKPITLEYNVERSQNVMVLIDCGQEMRVRALGSARTTRLDLVINAVVLFSYIAVMRGDRMGLMTYSDDIHTYLPPRPGLDQFYRIVDALYDVHGRPVETNHDRALRHLHSQRQRRSLITLFTEPTDSEATLAIVRHLGAFYPHHVPLCVTLRNMNVAAAALRTPYNMRSIYERLLAEQIMDERLVWQETLRQRGVMALDVPAYQLTSAVINKYLELKERTRI
ncbi:MAG: DUF58 domain-containing protein [Ardenticatenaceae bacterium]|nr:DUF58 domain-containing protein [Ardenticatenaceae bacterium]